MTGETILLAVDPGNSTGMAWVTLMDDCWESASFGCAEIDGRHPAERQFDTAVASDHTIIVVQEKFEIYAGTLETKIQYDSIWINGYIEGTCDRLGIEHHFQSPGARKTAKAWLPVLDWWRPTKDNHQMDAAMHLLTFIVNDGKRGKIIRRRVAG